MLPEWTKQIQKEDIPDDIRGLTEDIGLSNTLKVLEYFEGGKPYFRKLHTLFRKVRDRAIKNDWRSCRDPFRLAKKYDLTDIHIRRIVKDHEDQIPLFP